MLWSVAKAGLDGMGVDSGASVLWSSALGRWRVGAAICVCPQGHMRHALMGVRQLALLMGTGRWRRTWWLLLLHVEHYQLHPEASGSPDLAKRVWRLESAVSGEALPGSHASCIHKGRDAGLGLPQALTGSGDAGRPGHSGACCQGVQPWGRHAVRAAGDTGGGGVHARQDGREAR